MLFPLHLVSWHAFAAIQTVPRHGNKFLVRQHPSHSRIGPKARMSSMDEIPNLLASTHPDSNTYIGPVEVAPSKILGDDVSCGNGLFVTRSISMHELLFSIGPTTDAIISLQTATKDVDCGEAFRELSKLGNAGSQTVALAGWLAKTRICDLIDGDDSIRKRPDDFGVAYVRALPWSPEDQDHVIWWRQEEADRLLDGSIMYDEATLIRTQVLSAFPLLASIIMPVIQPRVEANAEGLKRRLGFEEEMDTDFVCNFLLSTYLRGAFVILMTRSFDDSLGLGGEREEESRLVPVLDTLQHTTGDPNVYHVYDSDNDCLEVFAARDLAEGDELVLTYHDDMSKEVFGSRFGFIPGEAKSVRMLLEEKNAMLFPPVII